jgi:Tfp pilus assembly protein PilV
MISMIPAKLMKGRRIGASLSEMVIALFVLGIVLLGMMAGILITQGSMLYKERERAVEIALRTLESFEARPFDKLSGEVRTEGMYVITVDDPTFNNTTVPVLSADSADIRVTVEWGRGVLGGQRKIEMNREVSASGWQNVGEFVP